MNKKLKLGLVLFLIGLLGVLTLLTVSLPVDNLPKEALQKISLQTLKFLVILSPTILLLITVIIGTLLYNKVGLTVPTISKLILNDNPQISFVQQIKYGVLFGLITGILTTIVGLIFKSSIPQELVELGTKLKVTPLARFGYGGITEELLMRFGFMTLIIWLVFKLSKKLNNTTYWLGIIIAALLFALGHFPVVYTAVSKPTLPLLTYILLGNSIAGIFLGWLYWKKGLEAAFIGHIFTHIAMLLGENIFKLQ